MPVTGAAIAGILVLGGLGFGAGYAIAGMGGDDDGGTKPAAKTGDPVLPAVPATSSKPKVVVLGRAPALPAPRRQEKKPDQGGSGPSSTPGPEPTAAPTSAPTAAPTSAPTSAPTPAPPDPDDIIEG